MITAHDLFNSPYLAAGVISARECVRATIEFLGTRKVQSNRDSGVGMWIQEIGNYLCCCPSLLCSGITPSSMARFLYACSCCLSTCFNGTPIQGEVRGRAVGVKSRTSRSLDDGPHGSAHRRCWDPTSEHDGCVTQIVHQSPGNLTQNPTASGWMHNRVRMIAAMYLTKDLMIDWRLGERVSGMRYRLE